MYNGKREERGVFGTEAGRYNSGFQDTWLLMFVPRSSILKMFDSCDDKKHSNLSKQI